MPTTTDPAAVNPAVTRDPAEAQQPGPLPAMAAPAQVVVLLARAARDRHPTATVWQLLTYDPHTRLPVAEIAQRWEPATTAAGLRPGHAPTVPDRIAQWLHTVLDGSATVTGPAHPYDSRVEDPSN